MSRLSSLHPGTLSLQPGLNALKLLQMCSLLPYSCWPCGDRAFRLEQMSTLVLYQLPVRVLRLYHLGHLCQTRSHTLKLDGIAAQLRNLPLSLFTEHNKNDRILTPSPPRPTLQPRPSLLVSFLAGSPQPNRAHFPTSTRSRTLSWSLLCSRSPSRNPALRGRLS